MRYKRLILLGLGLFLYGCGVSETTTDVTQISSISPEHDDLSTGQVSSYPTPIIDAPTPTPINETLTPMPTYSVPGAPGLDTPPGSITNLSSLPTPTPYIVTRLNGVINIILAPSMDQALAVDMQINERISIISYQPDSLSEWNVQYDPKLLNLLDTKQHEDKSVTWVFEAIQVGKVDIQLLDGSPCREDGPCPPLRVYMINIVIK